MDSDLNSLLNDATNSSSLDAFSMPSGMATLFSIFVIVTSVASLIIMVLYIMNMILTYRAHKATIETRDILRAMNERDALRHSAATPQATDMVATTPAPTETESKNT